MTTHAMRQAAADASNAPGLTTTLIVLSVVLGATVLCYLDKLDSAAYATIVSTIIGGVLVRAGVASGSAASSAPPAGD